MDVIGPIGDPQKDVAAVTPLVDHILDRIITALAAMLTGAGQGLLSALSKQSQ